MAHPCCAPVCSVRRIRRSSVPCRMSSGSRRLMVSSDDTIKSWCRTSTPWSLVVSRYSLVVGRVAVVERGFGAVRVAADFREAFAILGDEFDLPNPLGALPRVQRRRDHPARTAVLLRERFTFPGVYQQHVVFDRAREWQVGRVRDRRARHEVVAGAENVARLFFWDRELGDRLEADAAPMIVVTAPGRDTVEIAHLVHLRQGHELIPRQRERGLHEAADLELPCVTRDVRLFAGIEHRPVLDFVLPDRQLRHPVTVRRPAPFRPVSSELHVAGAFIQLDLPLDILLAPRDDSRVLTHVAARAFPPSARLESQRATARLAEAPEA